MSESEVPSLEQLRNLVDRAERRQLTEFEAAALRAGFASLEASRRSAGGLQAALQRVRRELAEERGESGVPDALGPSGASVPLLAAPQGLNGPAGLPPRVRPADRR